MPISLLYLVIILTLCPYGSESWGWFSTSSSATASDSDQYQGRTRGFSLGIDGEFSLQALDDPKARELVESARRKLGGSNPCWLRAYQNLFSSCNDIFAAEEKRSRLAWNLGDCFQKDTGRPPFPNCDDESDMVDCLRKLNNDDHKTYLEFYLETNSICYQLQSKAFRFQVENLVNQLKESAQFAEEKLERIEEKSDHLLHSSSDISESLTMIDAQTRGMGDTLKGMLDHVNKILSHSKELNDQARGIAASQTELLEGQGEMRKKLEEDMKIVQDSYNNLGEEIDSLQSKAIEMEMEIGKFGEEMSTRMERLQARADGIANVTDISLGKQQDLLDGQSKALDGLQSMTKFQSQALEESRITLKKFLDFADVEHKKLLTQQDQLLQAHDRLAENSKSILAAQEAFESKQSNVFAALDKLFALHNAMLAESRFLKAVFIYSALVFFLYMFTSAKETYCARFKLYLGLCIPFFLEVGIIRLASYDIEQQARFTNTIRLIYVLCAGIQLLYSYFTFRDYEALNYQMLMMLIEKVKGPEKGEKKYQEDDDMDDEIDWLSWVAAEVPEDLDDSQDSDYRLPEEAVGENSIVTTSERKYNLRRRP
ncbi:hypothetical protein Droror1_Dr00007031 [Drosera rotundifolia]